MNERLPQKELDRIVSDALSKNPNIGRCKLQAMLGETKHRIASSLARCRSGKPQTTAQPAPPQNRLDVEFKSETGIIQSVHENIRTLEDALAAAKVDLNVWVVDRHVINSWESAAFNKETGEWKPITLFQVKVWLVRDTTGEKTGKLAGAMIEALDRVKPVLQKSTPRNSNGLLLELSLFDVHLGKLCWGKEAGQDYDSEIAIKLFSEALEFLIDRSKHEKIERIVLPIGNDYFNVDNSVMTTTAGTPQQEDGRWQRSFCNGVRLMSDTIIRLQEIAPVTVITVPGNHDYERAFYLGEVMRARFDGNKHVTIDNTPRLRKYLQFGKCLIGWTHGNFEKFKNLPLIMAQECGAMWGETKFREVHCGHFHHKQELVFQPVLEETGIRVRVIPSLCPPDAWHGKHGYIALRAAESFTFDRNQGCISNHGFHP